LLDAIPDPMIRVARDGTYLDVRADDPSQLVGPPEELIGRNVREFLEPELAERVMACVERALDTGRVCTIEYEIVIGGEARWKESRMTPSGKGEVVTIVRDFTEQRRADAELRRLAEEQAALRRVATLVAGDAQPEHVFQATLGEVCRVVRIKVALLVRFEDGNAGTVVGRYGHETGVFEVGMVFPLEEGLAAWKVRQSGAPAHVRSYKPLTGEIAQRVVKLGFDASFAVPITVAGKNWGALIAALRADESLPPDAERRLFEFAELVALAVASAQAREELSSSRLRIIEASDAERRRLERNLHDGAQQRLVVLSAGLRRAQTKLRDSPTEADELLQVAADELGEALTELRELAQGIHPALLTDRGLVPALEVLAARAPLPVALDVQLPQRLPESVETAAYYVASEALANVVKHADASSATVRVARTNGQAFVEVADDGKGGVAFDTGTGLCGLRDRIETLDGRLHVDSPAGCGTLVRAELPLP
jgi:PAS domain S-box-containing protein